MTIAIPVSTSAGDTMNDITSSVAAAVADSGIHPISLQLHRVRMKEQTVSSAQYSYEDSSLPRAVVITKIYTLPGPQYETAV